MKKPVPFWLEYSSFIMVGIYFVVKYVAIGRDNLTTAQNLMLLAAFVVALFGIAQYRKQFYGEEERQD